MTEADGDDRGEYPGRRMRCYDCGERVRREKAYNHFRDCGGQLGYPYRPDRMDTDATTLEDFA